MARPVTAHFAIYVYGYTTEIASPKTLLSHNRFLKDTPTGKMQLVREEISRVMNCQRVTKKPSSELSFSQRAKKM